MKYTFWEEEIVFEQTGNSLCGVKGCQNKIWIPYIKYSEEEKSWINLKKCKFHELEAWEDFYTSMERIQDINNKMENEEMKNKGFIKWRRK